MVVAEAAEEETLAVCGNEPDYGSGPYLALLARLVRLARLDIGHPARSVEAREWLRSDLVVLFADCLGYEGGFDV